MKVAILGAGCYRTHAASGITNFTRACEVAEETGKEKTAKTREKTGRDKGKKGRTTSSSTGDSRTDWIDKGFPGILSNTDQKSLHRQSDNSRRSSIYKPRTERCDPCLSGKSTKMVGTGSGFERRAEWKIEKWTASKR